VYVNGSAKQFDVGYDSATKAITLDTSRGYEASGGAPSEGGGAVESVYTAKQLAENAKVMTVGSYVILLATTDNGKAEKVIDDMLKSK
jgi:hypothetical protein